MTSAAGPVLTSAQQRALDERAVLAGTPNERLMESAGAHAAAWILEHLAPASALILAGPGGNGGDALVVARHLHGAGVAVRTVGTHSPSACASLTQQMGQRLCNEGGTLELLAAENLTNLVGDVDCVIDGLFGSGLTRPLTDDVAQLTEAIRASAASTVSLDVPSGISTDSGQLLGPCVKADVTLAMAFTKPCHWLHPGAAYCGDVHVVGVDYPTVALEEASAIADVPSLSDIRALLPDRKPDGHKGTFGHVLVMAGSEGMTGAAILCARGALRAGAGLVTLAVSESIAAVIQQAVPEALMVPLPDEVGGPEAGGVCRQLEDAMACAQVLAIGPGLSRDARLLERARCVMSAFRGPMVIDAGAIHAFVDHRDLLRSLAGRAVITPHPGELGALVARLSADVDVNRIDLAQSFASQNGVGVVLKGRPTVIGHPNEPPVLNPTGNTGLATGGSGDVLAGLIAGLVAGGSPIASAATVGVYVHGLAADRWAVSRSERSLTPSDVLEALPRILKELET